jgi:hypothetical protein
VVDGAAQLIRQIFLRASSISRDMVTEVLKIKMVEDNHPTDNTLEECILRQMKEQEVETVETHVLGCEYCLVRLERLEVHIAAMKLALRDLQAEETIGAIEGRAKWPLLLVPRLSWVAIAALIAICASLPQIIGHRNAAPEVTLRTYRGADMPVIVGRRRTTLALDASDLPQGGVSVQVVDINGLQVWNGRTAIHEDVAHLTLPQLDTQGSYLLRLYSSAGHDGPQLLREFVFRVQ